MGVEYDTPPTLFDETNVDINYVPDDAIPYNSFYNTLGTLEGLRMHSDICTLGQQVWTSIRHSELLRDVGVRVEEFNAWRSGCITGLENVLEGIFPGRWEIQHDVHGDITDSIEFKRSLAGYVGDVSKLTGSILDAEFAKCYIHFPEILITNVNGDQWTILDYYVVIAFNNRLGVVSIRGFRATKTPVEYTTQYTFSHSKTADNNLCRFCFGSTGLDTLVAELLLGTYNEMSLELFLQNLTDYLSWESLDGVPFYFISELIRLRHGKGGATYMPSHITEEIISSIQKAREDINPIISQSSAGAFSVVIPIDMRLMEIVTKYTPKSYLYPLDVVGWVSTYPAKGVMSDEQIEDNNKKYALQPLFKFKGNDVVLKIVQDEKEQEDECRKYADTRIVSEVARTMALRINDFMYEYSWTGIREKAGVS